MLDCFHSALSDESCGKTMHVEKWYMTFRQHLWRIHIQQSEIRMSELAVSWRFLTINIIWVSLGNNPQPTALRYHCQWKPQNSHEKPSNGTRGCWGHKPRMLMVTTSLTHSLSSRCTAWKQPCPRKHIIYRESKKDIWYTQKGRAEESLPKGGHNANHRCCDAALGLGPEKRKPWEEEAGLTLPLHTWGGNEDSLEGACDSSWICSGIVPKAEWEGSTEGNSINHSHCLPSPEAEGKERGGRNGAGS